MQSQTLIQALDILWRNSCRFRETRTQCLRTAHRRCLAPELVRHSYHCRLPGRYSDIAKAGLHLSTRRGRAPWRCIVCTAVRTVTPLAAQIIRALSIGAVNVLDATPAAPPARRTQKLRLAARAGATSAEYVGAAAILEVRRHRRYLQLLIDLWQCKDRLMRVCTKCRLIMQPVPDAAACATRADGISLENQRNEGLYRQSY